MNDANFPERATLSPQQVAKANRAKYYTAGICYRCRELNVVPGKQTCYTCAETNNARKRAKTAAKKSAMAADRLGRGRWKEKPGECVRCLAPSDGPDRLCSSHRKTLAQLACESD